jgi:hypothetical protein
MPDPKPNPRDPLAALRRERTPDEARASLQRFIDGKQRICIPAQADDDDMILSDVIDDWVARGERLAALSHDFQKLAPALGAAPLPESPARIRPEVLAFARLMSAKIDGHNHDRGEYGWRTATLRELWQWLAGYVRALDRVLAEGEGVDGVPPSADRVAAKAANVANLAMMIADVAGALSPAPAPPCSHRHPDGRDAREAGTFYVSWVCTLCGGSDLDEEPTPPLPSPIPALPPVVPHADEGDAPSPTLEICP